MKPATKIAAGIAGGAATIAGAIVLAAWLIRPAPAPPVAALPVADHGKLITWEDLAKVQRRDLPTLQEFRYHENKKREQQGK